MAPASRERTDRQQPKGSSARRQTDGITGPAGGKEPACCWGIAVSLQIEQGGGPLMNAWCRTASIRLNRADFDEQSGSAAGLGGSLREMLSALP